MTGPVPNRFDLYEWCVQSPLMQARFLDALLLPRGEAKGVGGARVLRDDFCGPASIARAWVTLGPGYRAVGVDSDPEPLNHARLRAGSIPNGAGDRIELVAQSVMDVQARATVICAFNFALCELHDRRDLVTYLRKARESIDADGVIAVDLYGGVTAFVPGASDQDIQTPIGKARYTWEQREADPFTGRVRNAIHFRLPDRTKLNNAFEYDWRLWSVPEVRDAMLEAGFSTTEVHTGYGGAVTGDGELIVRPVAPGHDLEDEERDAWVAYVVGKV